MTKRKFFKTLFSIEVLSESPLENMDLHSLVYEITEGDCSAGPLNAHESTIDGLCCARELIAQGSDPEFFQLTRDGNDV